MRRADARSPSIRACALLQAFLCVGLLAAATAWARDDEPSDGVIVWEGRKDQWVRLEPRDDSQAPANEHPAQLDAAAVAGVMASVWIGTGDSAEPVFTPEEAQLFGAQIARALAQARPDQDVTFRTTGTRKSAAGKLFKGTRVNTGRVFRASGKLNVILGEIHGEYKKKNLYGQWEDDFTAPRPAARHGGGPHDWQLAASPGVEFQHTSDGGVRDDWLVFGSDQIVVLTTPVTSAASANPDARAPLPPRAAPALTNAQPVPAAQASPEADMERRLRVLKDLHDQGLITEEAYRAKVEEILSVL